MAILVQRSELVPHRDRAEFERRNESEAWPALLRQGVQMVAAGRWAFGGPSDSLVSHLRFESIDHLAAVDGTLVDGVGDGQPVFTARMIEGDTPAESRQPGGEGWGPAELPPTFGRGSVVSERIYQIETSHYAEFAELSKQHVWPWLERAGGRLIAFGRDPFGTSEELITLFAFRSVRDWFQLSRPSSEQPPPDEVVAAWTRRSALIERHRGRLLVVTTGFGRPV